MPDDSPNSTASTTPKSDRYPPGRYLFWETDNADEASANEQTFPQTPHEVEIEALLIDYAEEDSDGNADGCYYEREHPFTVKRPDGLVECWSVYGEPSISYHASRITNG